MARSVDQLLDDLLRREGGFVDHPADRGGPTHRGITLATLRAWRRRPVTVADLKALSVDETRAIYRERYLAPFADAEPELQAQLVDCHVLHGLGHTRRLLRRAYAGDPRLRLSDRLLAARLVFLARIVKARPDQATFLEGWIVRALEFLTPGP